MRGSARRISILREHVRLRDLVVGVGGRARAVFRVECRGVARQPAFRVTVCHGHGQCCGCGVRSHPCAALSRVLACADGVGAVLASVRLLLRLAALFAEAECAAGFALEGPHRPVARRCERSGVPASATGDRAASPSLGGVLRQRLCEAPWARARARRRPCDVGGLRREVDMATRRAGGSCGGGAAPLELEGSARGRLRGAGGRGAPREAPCGRASRRRADMASPWQCALPKALGSAICRIYTNNWIFSSFWILDKKLT